MEITFVTGNKDKLKEVQEILGNHIKVIAEDIDLPEIQSIESEQVAFEKAKEVYKIVDKPLIVEDVSLSIKSWNNLPGALIKWFMESVGNDGILKMLKGFEDRSATAKVVFAYNDGEHLVTFEGVQNGVISERSLGENGFGWDKIFVPEGYDKTFAQMTGEEKNEISTRKTALDKLKKYLNGKNE